MKPIESTPEMATTKHTKDTNERRGHERPLLSANLLSALPGEASPFRVVRVFRGSSLSAFTVLALLLVAALPVCGATFVTGSGRSGGSGSATNVSLSSLTDIALGPASNGVPLVYDAASGKWTNAVGALTQRSDVTNIVAGASNAWLSAAQFQATLDASDGMAFDSFESYADGTNVAINAGTGWQGDGVLVGGAAIVTRSLSGGRVEKRLELRGGQFARKMSWGSKWKRIFVAILCRTTATNDFTCDWFACGLASGTNNLVHSATTDNFIGFANSTGAGWTYSTGIEVPYLSHPWQRPAAKRGTDWTWTSTSGSTGRKLSASETVRCVWLVELDRVGTSYSGWAASAGAGHVENDVGFTTLVDTLRDNSPWDANYGLPRLLASAESASWTWDESTGALDTFNVGWTNTAVALEISAVVIRRCW
ncbi:MAG: hypothetical protein HZA90_19005 [Verrucomicrobia bacterium]|nr:hypothetical protein [Verrucomicrobiota bacterium]